MINSIGAVTPTGVGHLACDAATDVANLPAYAEANGLRLGTDCIVVATGDVYIMQSDFTFVKQ